MNTTTWLVEVALKGEGPDEWTVVSGCGSKVSAQAEVRQIRASRARRGYKVRIRAEA
jgi:sarcosine oxidase gamma subunit